MTTRPMEELLIDVVSVAGMRLKAWAFSAWSELVPVMYALFVLLRPRRFVELGVHNGMSFFAACQVAERLGLDSECVAVDSWIGDEHAGFHDTRVFDDFRAHLRDNYPHQLYIQSYFSPARRCFAEGSIDLLHIDGLHTYEAVKDDFETWLPKLSDVGVVIFHDTNVFERGFGVWRLWEEVAARYPAYAFSHKHGLGIIFVGKEPHPFASLLRTLASNRHHGTLAQAYFKSMGTLLIEHRSTLAALEQTTVTVPSPGVAAFDASPSTDLQQDKDEMGQEINRLRAQLNLVLQSTSWRATGPNSCPHLAHAAHAPPPALDVEIRLVDGHGTIAATPPRPPHRQRVSDTLNRSAEALQETGKMRIFVTGAAGFIGSNLVDRLLDDGHDVTGFDNFSTGQAKFLERAQAAGRFRLVRGDLLGDAGLAEAVAGAELVIHLAANADVRFGTDHPSRDLEQNVVATHNVLEAMRLGGVRRIAFSSTGSVYGEAAVFPTPEDAPFPIQTSLYGASKLSAEALISAYCEGFGLQGTVFRFVSILGSRYTHGHVLDFCKMLRQDPTTLRVLGNGRQRKSYLDVADCVDAILTPVLRRPDDKFAIFNLGTDEYCEVRDSIAWICDRLSVQPELQFTGGERGWIGDNPFIFLDCRKVRALGWQPRYTIRQGVERPCRLPRSESGYPGRPYP